MQNSTPEQGNTAGGNGGLIQRAKDNAPMILVAVLIAVIVFAIVR